MAVDKQIGYRVRLNRSALIFTSSKCLFRWQIGFRRLWQYKSQLIRIKSRKKRRINAWNAFRELSSYWVVIWAPTTHGFAIFISAVSTSLTDLQLKELRKLIEQFWGRKRREKSSRAKCHDKISSEAHSMWDEARRGEPENCQKMQIKWKLIFERRCAHEKN